MHYKTGPRRHLTGDGNEQMQALSIK